MAGGTVAPGRIDIPMTMCPEWRFPSAMRRLTTLSIALSHQARWWGERAEAVRAVAILWLQSKGV